MEKLELLKTSDIPNTNLRGTLKFTGIPEERYHAEILISKGSHTTSGVLGRVVSPALANTGEVRTPVRAT